MRRLKKMFTGVDKIAVSNRASVLNKEDIEAMVSAIDDADLPELVRSFIDLQMKCETCRIYGHSFGEVITDRFGNTIGECQLCGEVIVL